MASVLDEPARDRADDRALTPIPAASFAHDGFLGPIRLLEPQQCRALLAHLTGPRRPAPAVWPKGGAVTDWPLSRIGADPQLLRLLTPLLGDDVILWGTKLVIRKPGQIHTWHADEETSASEGQFVTVWIALGNVSGDSGLRLIAGSHLCGPTLEQFQSESGVSREETSTETALAWARGDNPGARLVEPELGDGEAILFDGRMWHGSHNRSTQTRAALVLHFAAVDSPVRIPSTAAQRPPAIVVQGKARPGANWLVPPPMPPPAKRLAPLASSIRELDLPLAGRPDGGWRPYPLFSGSTPVLQTLSCHAAVLSPGHSPHPPHAHQDEELLIVLGGEADLLIADRPSYDGARPVRVKAGDFAFYRALQHHTIRNPSDSPVTYLMFRWHGRVPAVGEKQLRSGIYRSPPSADAGNGRGFVTRQLFAGPTRWLGKLHCHSSRLEPGAGYAPHIDPYDVAIIVQSGRVKTLGRDFGPGAVIHYPKGEVHGMRNIGEEPARYIVFEFHGRNVLAGPRIAPSQSHEWRQG